MGDIIDFKSRLRPQNSSTLQVTSGDTAVVNIGPLREAKINADRRQVKRTILTEFIAVHAVIPGQGLLKVHLYDINDHGLSFDLDENKGHFNIGEAVELRIYLNHQTYFRIDTKIAHITNPPDEGVIRHGCEFLRDSMNDEALSHFIKFLESVTAGLRRDGGDILVSKINS